MIKSTILNKKLVVRLVVLNEFSCPFVNFIFVFDS